MLTLILLPGLDGTGDLFNPLLNEIGDQFNVQVIRYLHIRIDPAIDWHDHPATLSHAKVAGLAHFKVATYSHFKPATDP